MNDEQPNPPEIPNDNPTEGQTLTATPETVPAEAQAEFEAAVQAEVSRREQERQSAEARVADAETPWGLAAQNGSPENQAQIDPRSGRADDVPAPYTGPGAVTHSEPVLGFGSAGPEVRKLAELLAAAGYKTNTVIRGENAANVLDTSVMADVRRFCADHGVTNNLDEFQGREVAANDLVGQFVGAYIWQALYNASTEAVAA